MTIGDIIKKYREEHSMTMQRFADISGISKAYISMLESNKNPRTGEPIKPSLETIQAVSKVMGMSATELLTKIDSNQEINLLPKDSISLSYSGSTDKTISVDELTYALCNETKDLTEEQKNLLLSIAKGFKGNK